MHILLTVLAVIGKILLGIIALLLLLILLLLFVPFGYRAGCIHESGTGFKNVTVPFGIAWLAGLVGAEGQWQGGDVSIAVKVLGFTIKRIGKKPDQKSGKDKKKETKESSAQDGSAQAPKPPGPEDGPSAEAEEVREKQPEPAAEPENTRPGSRQSAFASPVKQTAQKLKKKISGLHLKAKDKIKGSTQGKQIAKVKDRQTSVKAEKAGRIHGLTGKLTDRLSSLMQAVIELLTSLPDLLWKLPDSADEIEQKICGLRKKIKPWLSRCSKQAYSAILKQVRYLIRHYKPRKVCGHLEFGTGDPALTGIAGGIIYQALPPDSAKFNPQPCFYERKLDTDVAIKGHIRICHIVKAAIVLLLNKNIRKIIRRLRRARGGK